VRRFVIRDVRFFINSVDRAVSSIRGAGFDVECDKAEDEEAIEYLIRIPKP
jgi:ParB family chromosome partitioning protein